jgi:hypothetical protein
VSDARDVDHDGGQADESKYRRGHQGNGPGYPAEEGGVGPVATAGERLVASCEWVCSHRVRPEESTPLQSTTLCSRLQPGWRRELGTSVEGNRNTKPLT